MATILSTCPSSVATLPDGLKPVKAACPISNVSIMRIPLVGGLRLQQKVQFSRAIVGATRSRKFKTTISCAAAQPETLETVQIIIANQLSIDTSAVTPQTKFADLGADSLDTVEIMMALEETFGVSVGEGGTESIVTVQDAADLIETVKSGEA